ncbi:MAG: imidazoleglycerol-phosphate dehydratase [Cirrosporium novae-zelandiae]|nr:MAG: imidazoleglycerol-phosphate dehydratase [Cirrosporium novae-zelandiae]
MATTNGTLPTTPTITPLRRTATGARQTKETTIQLSLSLDGGELTPLPILLPHFPDVFPDTSRPGVDGVKGRPRGHATQITKTQMIDVDTGLGFLDHMLHALAKHAGWSLLLTYMGGVGLDAVDDHHTAEDIFLLLGSTFHDAVFPPVSLHRFGSAHVPLDEALSRSVVDLSNRPYAHISLNFKREKVGDVSTEMLEHALRSFAEEARICLHVDNLRGENDHHKAESAFKATAVALREACERRIGVGEGELGSSKGVL